jgi:hypothetical protein
MMPARFARLYFGETGLRLRRMTKFLDVMDLGEDVAPNRISVMTNRDKTPRLLVLGRTSRILPADSPVEQWLAA